MGHCGDKTELEEESWSFYNTRKHCVLSDFYVCNILASTRYYLTMSTFTCLRAGKCFRLNSNESELL